jgi:hypothetical protein
MQQKPRALALVLATLAAAAVPTLAVCALMLFFREEDGWITWLGYVAALTFGIALVHLALLGLPAVAWLFAKQKFRAWTMMLVGALVAMIPVSLLALPGAPWGDQGDTWGDWVEILLVFAPIGALSALAFYYVCRAMTKAPAAA